MNFELNQTVYHREVYNHKEPLRIVGIKETELELEGDYSGGTHNVCQKQWMPIKGVSRIYNHDYKQKSRQYASDVETLLIPAAGSKTNEYKSLVALADIVMHLTADVEMNPEFV